MKFKVACIQLSNSFDINENLVVCRELIEKAAKNGAQMIFTPENTDLIHNSESLSHRELYKESDHITLRSLKELAKELKIWLHIGSVTIAVEGQEKYYNRSYMIAPNGEIKAKYDKIHLFDSDIGPNDRYKESSHFTPGQHSVVVNTDFGMLGLSICYDLRFPTLYRHLAKKGAIFISIPAAFTKITGLAHWHVLLRARAIETGCYIFAAAQTGLHNGARKSFGHSLIVDPWGEVLADAETDVGIIEAEIDTKKVESVRKIIPAIFMDQSFV